MLGETITKYFSKTRTIPCSILRYWYPYTDDPSSEIDYFQSLLRRFKNDKLTTVLPAEDAEDPGYEQPLFIDDIVRITTRSAQFAQPSGFVLNVAGAETLTLRQIVETMAEVFELEPRIESESPDKEVNLLRATYDLQKLENPIGLPQVSFCEGLLRLKQNM